jgi:hypothetical protein
MNAFYEHHQDSIRFGYRCFDRLLLNGLIQPFQQPSDRILQHLSPAVSGEPRRFARNRQPIPELGPLAKLGRTDSRITGRPPRQVSGRAVQLLHQRRALGTHVRPHVPLPAVLSPRLPQSTSLAGSAHARIASIFSNAPMRSCGAPIRLAYRNWPIR